MKLLCLGTLISSSLVVAACNPGGTPADNSGGTTAPETGAFKSILPLAACDPTDIKGTVNITLPPNLNGGPIQRNNRVTYGTDILPSGSDDPGAPNPPKWKINGASDPRPFDVFMKDTVAEFGETGHVEVRIVVRGNTGWKFQVDDTASFYGVGRYSEDDQVLCGARAIGGDAGANGANQAKYVASFYVDLDALYAQASTYGAPFVIGLMAGNTPVYVDPKVWNDGAGSPTSGGQSVMAAVQQLPSANTQANE